LIWEHETTFDEILVSSEEDGVQHGLVEAVKKEEGGTIIKSALSMMRRDLTARDWNSQEIAHPFRDDDVDLVDWENDFFHLALDECNGWIITR
jgi:hypothetical protein